MLPANCTKEIKPLVTHVIDLIFGQSEDGKKGQLLAEFTALAPAMLDVIKKAASTAALAVKPVIPSFTMPDLSGVTGVMSNAFDAVKKKTQSAVDAVKGKVDNFMPKKPHWREQLKQLQEQVANMGEHVSAIPTIKDLEGKVEKLKAELNAAHLPVGEPPSVAQKGQDPLSQTVNNQDSLGILSQPQQSNAEKKLSDPFNAMSKSFNSKQPPPPSVASLSSDPFPTSGGRRTHRNTHRNSHSRRIRASTRALRQRARE